MLVLLQSLLQSGAKTWGSRRGAASKSSGAREGLQDKVTARCGTHATQQSRRSHVVVFVALPGQVQISLCGTLSFLWLTGGMGQEAFVWCAGCARWAG